MNRKDLPAPNSKCVICGHEYYRCKRCIELKMQGVEIWRLYCDSYECAMIDTLLKEDPANITREMYENVASIELPNGRKMNEDVKKKLDEIGARFKNKEEKVISKSTYENQKADENKNNVNDAKYAKTYNGYAWNSANKKNTK